MSHIRIYPKGSADPGHAQRWPADEPIPDWAAAEAPPQAEAGHRVEWDGEGWAQVADTGPGEAPEEAPPPAVDVQALAEAVAAITTYGADPTAWPRELRERHLGAVAARQAGGGRA